MLDPTPIRDADLLWFRSRYPRFVHVDRVATVPEARGSGHARRLDAGLAEAARDAGRTRLVCEVDAEPPNPASDAFHAAIGFQEVGRAAIHASAKTVRYLELPIAPAPA